jgi:hypothetical protein
MERTLLLNQSYEPLTTISWQRAISLLTFRRGKQAVKFSRHNILARDRWKCQYCGIKVKSHEMTMDHVVPRSQGGLPAGRTSSPAARTATRRRPTGHHGRPRCLCRGSRTSRPGCQFSPSSSVALCRSNGRAICTGPRSSRADEGQPGSRCLSSASSAVVRFFYQTG